MKTADSCNIFQQLKCLFVFWQFQYQTLSFCFVLYKCSYKVNNKAAAVCRYFSIALITTCICRFAAVLKFTASCDQKELKWRKSSGDGAFSLSLCLVCYFFWGCHCTYGNRTCCHQPHWCRFTSLVSPRVTKWVRSSKRRCTQTESVTNGVNIISSRLTLWPEMRFVQINWMNNYKVSLFWLWTTVFLFHQHNAGLSTRESGMLVPESCCWHKINCVHHRYSVFSDSFMYFNVLMLQPVLPC